MERTLIELRPWFEAILARLVPEAKVAWSPQWAGELAVPHHELKVRLEADPVASALLPGVTGYLTLGETGSGLFQISASGVVRFSPVLMQDSGALVLAARLAFEALHAMRQGVMDARRVISVLRHARQLRSSAADSSLAVMAELLPGKVFDDLCRQPGAAFSAETLRWFAGLMEGVKAEGAPEAAACNELELPLEHLLVSGGDNRLVVDLATGLNAYGVCPRPRPEAVHFSSSTASAISAHGFLLADMLRRHLLDRWLEQHEDAIRPRLVAEIAHELAALMGYGRNELAMALCASGTDTETAAVLVAHAGAGGKKVCNVLVAPEESGRGVVLAGEGRYFDSVTAAGSRVAKGDDAFRGRLTEVREVAIRDEECRVRDAESVGREWQRVAREALAAGCHVLAHVLLGSKTGLTAPEYRFVEEIMIEAPERVDVVVDACQLRSSWAELRALVECGWMVQISGSKFLTGPPFAGALLLPEVMRSRAPGVRALLAEGCGTGHVDDWVGWWQAAERPPLEGSLGPLLRWLPALMEAHLFDKLNQEQKSHAFERFRQALLPRFAASRWIQAISDEISDSSSDLARLSIIAFQVRIQGREGGMRALDEEETKKMFRLLNRDLSHAFAGISLKERAAAALQCHIGQPVVLNGAKKRLAFLRLVLGARFFNLVAYAGGGAWEAAVMAEISDASRVLDKIELLASRWDDLTDLDV